MKWFIGFLCLLTVYLLFDGLSLSAHSSSDKKHKYTSSQSINPVKEQEILPVEKEWLAYLQEQEEEKPAPEAAKNNKVDKPPYPTITIGEKNYQLLGIFKKDKHPFVLLKAVNSELIELQEGAALSEGVVLQAITASAITLSQGDELIKFKLFERSDHVE
jgi:hypothetical protein